MSLRRAKLTLEILSGDASRTRLVLDQEDTVERTLRLLTNPRLLSLPQLVLTSAEGVSAIACRGVDIILARTLVRTPAVFPLIFPAGVLDLVEHPQDEPESDFIDSKDSPPRGPEPLSPVTMYLEVHSFGGWTVTLKAITMVCGSFHDQRHPIARLFALPVIAFRLLEGGIGIVNPANIIRVRAWPRLRALPDTPVSAGALELNDFLPGNPREGVEASPIPSPSERGS